MPNSGSAGSDARARRASEEYANGQNLTGERRSFEIAIEEAVRQGVINPVRVGELTGAQELTPVTHITREMTRDMGLRFNGELSANELRLASEMLHMSPEAIASAYNGDVTQLGQMTDQLRALAYPSQGGKHR